MRKAKEILAGTAALGLMLQGPAVEACTPAIPPEKSEIEAWKKACKLVLKDRETFITQIKNGEISSDLAWDFARRFSGYSYYGPGVLYDYGCANDRQLAFDIAASLTGWPESKELSAYEADFLRGVVPATVPLDERRRLYWLSWIKNPHFFEGLPEGWTEEEVKQLIVRDVYWDFLRKTYGTDGTSPLLDRLLFEVTIEPHSPRFSLDDALTFLPRQHNISIARKTQLAELLVDPAIGHLDYTNAAKLLDWYSPNDQSDIPQALVEKARSIWAQIAQNMTESEDPLTRQEGQAILKTGDPYYVEQLQLSETTPSDYQGLLQLDEWPNDLPPMQPEMLDRIITAASYPRRSLHREEQGAVRLALLFGHDGSFSKLVVLNSSGHERLDKEAYKVILRRFRPKLTEMKLNGFFGQNVLVPLPVVEWRVAADGSPSPGDKRYRDGRIIVVAKNLPRPERHFGISVCGSRAQWASWNYF